MDLHSYQPTVDDILKISDADMFIYVGGESDEWVKEVFNGGQNPDMVVMNLLEELGNDAKIEELVEGMQPEDHDHGHGEEDTDHHEEDNHEEDTDNHEEDSHEEDTDHHEDNHDVDTNHEEESHPEGEDTDHHEDHEEGEDEDHDHEGEEVFDEHVWLSLKNTKIFCNAITESLSMIYPEYADEFKDNLDAYIERLNTLDSEYQTVVNEAAVKTLLFGDRFPFRYLVDDYGLEYYAAFLGCSAETEATFETVVGLAQRVDEHKLRNVMVLESSDQAIAKTIINNTNDKNQQILVMDSMQSVTPADVERGTTYFSIMENNLAVLREALK